MGTAFPFVERFIPFGAIGPEHLHLLELSNEQWKVLIEDLLKVGVVCAITGQNDIHALNIGFGKDGKVYVVDYDLCDPTNQLSLESNQWDKFVELPLKVSRLIIYTLEFGIDEAWKLVNEREILNLAF
jgi:hypothetical protein